MDGERDPASRQAVRKIQLSSGPSGRLGSVIVFAMLALAAISWSAGDPIRFFSVLGVIGLTVYSITHVLRHTREHPVSGTIDGAGSTHDQQYLGTKSEPRILPSELVADVVYGPKDRMAAPPYPGQTPAAPIQERLTLNLPSAPAPESPPEDSP